MNVSTVIVPYIPNPDAEALRWLENFFNTLSPHPKAFGVDPRDVETLGRRIHEFRAWLALAESPDARAAAKAAGVEGLGETGGGGGTATEKTIARNAAVASVQLLVGMIEDNPLTTDRDLQDLGLPVPAQREPHPHSHPDPHQPHHHQQQLQRDTKSPPRRPRPPQP